MLRQQSVLEPVVMLAFTVARGAASLCRPVQLVARGNRVCVECVATRGVGWRRLVSGEAKTIRAIPVESGGVRARLSGTSCLCETHCQCMQLLGVC